MGKTSPLYKYKGTWPIEHKRNSLTSLMIVGRLPFSTSIDRINLLLYFYLFSLLKLFQSTTCCSSFVSATSEGVLGGLPTLEQPYVHQLRRSPSWADIRRSTVNSSQHHGLTALPRRSDCLAQRSCSELSLCACWSRRGVNRLSKITQRDT
jgi:hypothetical protein